mmetsp:Transcript_84868/g.248761  ORF Transcript_84868/g.248761 Transcript_84868/m.248761 type:complete len:308 (-) Transcript_84868:367-1290(-)
MTCGPASLRPGLEPEGRLSRGRATRAQSCGGAPPPRQARARPSPWCLSSGSRSARRTRRRPCSPSRPPPAGRPRPRARSCGRPRRPPEVQCTRSSGPLAGATAAQRGAIPRHADGCSSASRHRRRRRPSACAPWRASGPSSSRESQEAQGCSYKTRSGARAPELRGLRPGAPRGCLAGSPRAQARRRSWGYGRETSPPRPAVPERPGPIQLPHGWSPCMAHPQRRAPCHEAGHGDATSRSRTGAPNRRRPFATAGSLASHTAPPCASLGSPAREQPPQCPCWTRHRSRSGGCRSHKARRTSRLPSCC